MVLVEFLGGQNVYIPTVFWSKWLLRISVALISETNQNDTLSILDFEVTFSKFYVACPMSHKKGIYCQSAFIRSIKQHGKFQSCSLPLLQPCTMTPNCPCMPIIYMTYFRKAPFHAQHPIMLVWVIFPMTTWNLDCTLLCSSITELLVGFQCALQNNYMFSFCLADTGYMISLWMRGNNCQ